MRWFARRLVFYGFALWVALTINFLLPRLMPGDALGGILSHLSPSQISANPGIVQTYKPLLGGGNHSIWHDYVVYLGRIAHFDFGISTSNYPAPVSDVIGRTLPYSIFLVGVAFLLSFVIGIAVGMFAAWRRGGAFDNVLVPTFMVLSAFPAFFTALLGLYFFGLKFGLVPDPACIRQRAHSRVRLGLLIQCVPSCPAADPRHPRRVRRRLGAEHAHGDDQHDRRGLRHARAREGIARPSRDDALRGPERDPAAAQRLRAAVRERGRRARLHRVHLQLPGRRLHAAAGGARKRLCARAGASSSCSRSA